MENPIESVSEPSQPLQPSREGQIDKERFNKELKTQLTSMKSWQDLPDFDKKLATKKFMNHLGDLYLDFFQVHHDEAKACAEGYQDVLKNELSTLNVFYCLNLVAKLNKSDEYDSPWALACRGRTNIEAFNEMFGDFTHEKLPTKVLDEYMEARKGLVGLSKDEIPKNAPSSHWWWFIEYGQYN